MSGGVAVQAPRFLVEQDLGATHTRRVRVMVLLISLLLAGSGLLFGLFFILHGHWAMVGLDVCMVGLGATLALLVRHGRMRLATLVLFGGLFVTLAGMALLVDTPVDGAPRTLHYYFPALALGTYFMLRREPPWLRHGAPLLCLAMFAWLASEPQGWASPYAMAPGDRPPVAVVVGLALGILYLLMHVFMGDISRMEDYLHSANNRFVGLVRGMFPAAVAERLLASGQTFAERYQDCSILFADIVGFTALTERMAPEALVGMLSKVFSRFDRCVEQAGLTKIKTIGDAYMVAAGVPESHPGHAAALVALARQMQQEVRAFDGLSLRIGIASGELVAGVIGQTRQVFDVWGDVVNLASRMESHGLPGRIQVSESCYRLVKEQFDFERRPAIAIKGKQGAHDVYMLRAT